MLSGEVTPSQMGGFLMALRVRGETVEEITGAVTAMRAKMLRGRRAARRDRRRRHRRRRLGLLQRLDARRADRRRLRRAGRQARQSRRFVEVGRRRRARRARRQDRRRAGGGRALHPRGRHRLHDGADASCGDAPRRPDPRRTRHPHHLQPARAAVQSGRGQAPADRRLLRRLAASRWPRCCATSAPSGSGSPTAPTGSTK